MERGSEGLSPGRVERMHQAEIASLLQDINDAALEPMGRELQVYKNSRRIWLQAAAWVAKNPSASLPRVKVSEANMARERARRISEMFPEIIEEIAPLMSRVDEIDRQHGWSSY